MDHPCFLAWSYLLLGAYFCLFRADWFHREGSRALAAIDCFFLVLCVHSHFKTIFRDTLLALAEQHGRSLFSRLLSICALVRSSLSNLSGFQPWTRFNIHNIVHFTSRISSGATNSFGYDYDRYLSTRSLVPSLLSQAQGAYSRSRTVSRTYGQQPWRAGIIFSSKAGDIKLRLTLRLIYDKFK